MRWTSVPLFVLTTGLFASSACCAQATKTVLVEQTKSAANAPELRRSLAKELNVDMPKASGATEVEIWSLPNDVTLEDVRHRLARNTPFRAVSFTQDTIDLGQVVGPFDLPSSRLHAATLALPSLDALRPAIAGLSLRQVTSISDGGMRFSTFRVNSSSAKLSDGWITATPLQLSYSLQVVPGRTEHLSLESVSDVGAKGFSATFRLVGGDGELFLQRSGDSVYGSFRRDRSVYSLTTTDTGKVVAIALGEMATKLHPTAHSETVPCSDGQFSDLTGPVPFLAADPKASQHQVRLLVVATRDVEPVVPFATLPWLIKPMVAEVNRRLASQFIPMEIVLASDSVDPVAYTDTCQDDMTTCWRRLCNAAVAGTDGFGDVRRKRDEVKADIVLVLVSRLDSRALSADIGATAGNAYIIMSFNALQTFPHELAHLAGAYHNPACGETHSFPGRHGYLSVDGTRSTVEAGPCNGSITQTMWSDPSDRLPGDYPAGDTCCDTAGLLRGAAARLAGFR